MPFANDLSILHTHRQNNNMATLPSDLTLLPTPSLSASKKTALLVNIPNDILQTLKKSNGHGIKLSLGPKMSLRVGNKIITLETSPLEYSQYVYQSDGNSTVFNRLGAVAHKLSVSSTTIVKSSKVESPVTTEAGMLSSKSPSRLPSPPSKPKFLHVCKPLSSMPINSAPLRAIHLLALAPISPQHMVQRTKISRPEVESLLKEYGRRLDDDTYTLADNSYQYLRVWERKYSEEQRESVIENSIKAFDRLEYPSDHPARKNLSGPETLKIKSELSFEKYENKRQAKTEALVAKNQPKAPQEVTQNSSVSSNYKHQPVQNYKIFNDCSPIAQKMSKTDKRKASNGSAYRSSSSSNSSSGSEPETKLGSVRPRYISSSNEFSPHMEKVRPQYKKLSASSHLATSSGVSTGTHKRKMSISHAAAELNGPPKRPHVERQNGTRASSFFKPHLSLPQSANKTNSNDNASISCDTVSRDQDMFALAQKFREKYTIYVKLYRSMSTKPRSAGATDRSRVQELVSMHKELESVKKRLWQMSPSVVRSPAKHVTNTARAGLR